MAEYAAMIGELFAAYRADPGRSREAGGTGLGLAISRDLARGIGGELSVLSSSPEGTVFQLRLPRKPAVAP